MIAVHAIFDRENMQSALLDSISIIIAVLLCIGVSAFNNYQKEKQFLALYKASQKSKKVRKESLEATLTCFPQGECYQGWRYREY